VSFVLTGLLRIELPPGVSGRPVRVAGTLRDGDGEATHLSQWAGLASRSPLTAGVMSLFLLALAGMLLTVLGGQLVR